MPFQPNFQSLGIFLTKHTPAKSVQCLHFPSTTRSIEFLRFLITLKRLGTRLVEVHLSGRQVTRNTLETMQSLLGKWTSRIILDSPQAIDVVHITDLIAWSPRLKVFSLQTTTNFRKRYGEFIEILCRAGSAERLPHSHPEINPWLRTLHLSSLTCQSIKFSTLADLGKYFPLLEMLRIEN